MVVDIAGLWDSGDRTRWDEALGRYWDFVRPANIALEQRMASLDARRIHQLSSQDWVAAG